MKRVICFLVITILTLMMFSGCSGTRDTGSDREESSAPAKKEEPKQEEPKKEEPKQENVKLKLFHGKQEAQETFSAIIKEFNVKYPNITVEQEVVTNDPAAVLKARLATGEIPDIFSCGIEVIDISKGGYLADLTNEPFLKNIVDDVVKSRTFTNDTGKTWAMPIDGSCIGVFYNRKLFADNGLAVPQTLSDLKNVCETFKGKNIPAFALGFKDGWTIKIASITAFSPAVYGRNINWDIEKNSGTAAFASTEGWKTAFDILKLMYEYSNKKTAFDTDYNGACSMFAQGKSAMMAQGLWALEPIRKITPDIDVGIMGIPVSENPSEAKLHQFPDFSLSISAKSKYPDECKKFFEFMTTREIAELWCNKAKLFSAVKGVSTSFDPVADDVNKLISEGRICTQADRGWPTPFHPEFEKVLPDFLMGKKDVKATLETLDKAWDKAKSLSQ